MDTGHGGSVNAVLGIATAKRRETRALGRALTRRVRRLCFQLGASSGTKPGVDMRGLGLWFR